MTQTKEAPRKEAPKMVKLELLGIATTVGLNAYPEGRDPVYVEFEPGKPTDVREDVVEELLKVDFYRFKRHDEEKLETTSKTDTGGEQAQAKAEAAPKKRGRKSAKK